MKVSVKFKSIRLRGQLAGEITRYHEFGTYSVPFFHSDWVKFRKGSGKGSRPTQKDYLAFAEYLSNKELS